jgi:hypothetical protein
MSPVDAAFAPLLLPIEHHYHHRHQRPLMLLGRQEAIVISLTALAVRALYLPVPSELHCLCHRHLYHLEASLKRFL